MVLKFKVKSKVSKKTNTLWSLIQKYQHTTTTLLPGSFTLRRKGGYFLFTLFRKCNFNASCETGPLNLSHSLTLSDKLTDMSIFWSYILIKLLVMRKYNQYAYYKINSALSNMVCYTINSLLNTYLCTPVNVVDLVFSKEWVIFSSTFVQIIYLACDKYLKYYTIFIFSIFSILYTSIYSEKVLRV